MDQYLCFSAHKRLSIILYNRYIQVTIGALANVPTYMHYSHDLCVLTTESGQSLMAINEHGSLYFRCLFADLPSYIGTAHSASYIFNATQFPIDSSKLKDQRADLTLKIQRSRKLVLYVQLLLYISAIIYIFYTYKEIKEISYLDISLNLIY